MSVTGVGGGGGNIIGTGGTAGASSAPEGSSDKFGAVKLNTASTSLAGQAAQTANMPAQTQAAAAAFAPQGPQKAQDGDGGDVDSKDEKDDKDKKEVGAEGKEAMKRVSDVDKRQRHRQEGGMYDRLKRMAEIGKIKSQQQLIEILWGEAPDQESDVTDAYVAMRDFQQIFSEEKDPKLQKFSGSLSAAGDLMMKEEGGDIRAGFLFGTENKDSLQFYRNLVVAEPTVSGSFEVIMKRTEANPKKFMRDIDKLISDVKIDMAAAATGNSTIGLERLQVVNEGLFKLHMCNQIPRDCHLVLEGLAKEHNVGPYAAPPAA